MGTSYNEGCRCGAIRYEIAAEPLLAGHCQCRDCQRESGTGHTLSLAFPAPAVKLEGMAMQWETAAASGNIVTSAFCPKCGSPVYARNSGMPELFIVRAASLDDPTRYAPQTVVWTASGFAWDRVDSALLGFAKNSVLDPSQ